jgi:hypothetical protein
VIAEAWEAAVAVGWALAAWIVVLSAALTIAVLAAAVTGAFAVRGAWRGVVGVRRGLGGPVAAVRALEALRCHPERYRPPLRPLWAAA